MVATPGQIQPALRQPCQGAEGCFFTPGRQHADFAECPALRRRPLEQPSFGRLCNRARRQRRLPRMQQHHAQVHDQVRHRRAALECATLLDRQQIVLQRPQQLHQPCHGGDGAAEHQTDGIEQQPGTLSEGLPTSFCVGGGVQVCQLYQQIAIGVIQLVVEAGAPEWRINHWWQRFFRQVIRVDTEAADMRFAKPTVIVDRANERVEPVQYARLQPDGFLDMLEQCVKACILAQCVLGIQRPIQQHQRRLGAEQQVHAPYSVLLVRVGLTLERQRHQHHARRQRVVMACAEIIHTLQPGFAQLAVELGMQCTEAHRTAPFTGKTPDALRALLRVVQLTRDIEGVTAPHIDLADHLVHSAHTQPQGKVRAVSAANPPDRCVPELAEAADCKLGQSLLPFEDQRLTPACSGCGTTRHALRHEKFKDQFVRTQVAPGRLAQGLGKLLTGVVGQGLDPLQGSDPFSVQLIGC